MADQRPLSSNTISSSLQVKVPADNTRVTPRGAFIFDEFGYLDPSLDPSIQKAKFKDRYGGAIRAYSYPVGVGNDEQPHWLKIQVRVREQNSQAQAGLTNSKVYHETNARRLDPDDNLTVAALTGATAVGNIAGEITQQIPAGKVLGGIGGAAIGAGLGVIGAALQGENELYTLNSVIGLGLQSPPDASYSASWTEAEMGPLMGGGVKNPLDLAMGVGTEVLKKNMNPSRYGVTQQALLGSNPADALESATGRVRNPYREQVFKQIEFRNFGFSFTFLPESVEEAHRILEIIKILKRNMLPEVHSNAFFLIYPSEFSLTYMYKGNPNFNVHQFSDCVLTNLSVVYGSNDFVTFKNSDGTPAEININLVFREIVPITADRAVNEYL